MNEISKRKIIHIDMDAFYASIEQRDFPKYRNKAIAVGGSPNGRGVVATCSYEARKYGIHSAMPSSKAKQLCPHLIFIKPRFDVYKRVSKQIQSIFYEITDLVEPLSLDEAYLDVTSNYLDNPSATLVAREIKQKIRATTSLTASAGVSYCKFLAKIASDLHKPDGLSLIEPDKAIPFIEQLEIGKFYGIGKATEKKMKQLNIYTGSDLKALSEHELVQHFGKQGHFFYTIARGIDKRAVKAQRIRKSVGKERTFPVDVEDINWMKSFLTELSEKVSQSLHSVNASGKVITLKVRYADFETHTRSKTLEYFTNDKQIIADTAVRLLDETEAGEKKVRLLGITLSNLDINYPFIGKQLELPLYRC